MSLLPGWDSNLSDAPKAYADHEDETEPHGYFAKLEKSRSSRHSDGVIDAPFVGALPPSYSMHRGSISQEGAPDLGRKSSECAHGPETLKAAAQRCGSIKHPPQHSATDWSEELETLSGGHKVKHEGPKHEAGKPDTWWSHMDAGAMNLHADVPEDKSAAKHGFVPQFNVASQKLQYETPCNE